MLVDSTIIADSTITRYIQPYKQQLDARMNQVIGYSAQHLNKNAVNGQSLVGNFFADALLAIGQQLDPETIVSFATKGGIRSDVKAGKITVGHVFELMPFENYITILSLKGSELIKLATFIAKAEGHPISNMQVIIKDKQVVDFLIDGNALDTQKTYKVVTYDYLANGGDYTEGLNNPIKRFDTDLRVREALIGYIENLEKNNQTLDAQIDERVKIIK